MKQFLSKLTLASILFPIVLLFFSCRSKQNNVYTYPVQYSDFFDKLSVVGELQPSTSTNISCPRLRADATVSYLVEHGKRVEKGDTVCILEAQGIISKYDQANSDLENAKAEYRKVEAQLHLDTQILIAQKETIEASEAIKQLDSIQQKFVSSSRKKLIELELKKSELEKQKIVNRLNSLKKINKSKLRQKELKIKQAENQLRSAKSLLNQLIIIAPSSGTFLRAKERSNKFITTGDVIWGGMAIGKIPNSQTYHVNFALSEQDCKRIEKGFYFDSSLDSSKFVCGKIKNKASVGIPIEQNSEVNIFKVIAEIDSLNFKPKPGESIFCKITTKTISDAYILPLLSVFQEDSIQVVYVANKDKFERRKIKITYKNAVQAIVKEGFSLGESVALIKPNKSLILNKDTSNE